jgi:DeoR/GlpR family transcriptional regulator of sugar metabolism
VLPEERRQRIVEALGTRGLVRVDDLVALLDVSAETVRRDLIELERRGELSRVYGGATRNGDDAERPLPRRDVANPDCKRAIAMLAATLVRPHQTVIFDVGTTVLELARALPLELAAQALTNSAYTAQELARRPNVQIHLAGGEVRADDLACSGPETEEFFGGFFADVAFLCAGGVHAQAGLTDFYPREIAVRRHMLQRSTERYVLADSSKLGRVALRRVCDLTAVTAVITDAEAPREALDALAGRGVTVMVAAFDGAQLVAPSLAPDAAPSDPSLSLAFDVEAAHAQTDAG